MSEMLPDEILREAARILARGYPPDALGPVKSWVRVRDADGNFWDRAMYDSIGRLRQNYPNPNGGRYGYANYETERRRTAGYSVVRTIEIPIEVLPFEDAVWKVKEANDEKKKAAAAKRLAKRMSTNE